MNCCTQKTGRWSKAAGSVASGAIAILLPKCPLCIAAWIAAGTGVAVPAMLAGSVRPVLAMVCIVCVLLMVRAARTMKA